MTLWCAREHRAPYATRRSANDLRCRDVRLGRLGLLERDASLREGVTIDFPPEALAHLADAVAAQVAERIANVLQARPAEGYLAPEAAAEYLGVSRRRVYDLTSARAITPDGKDGRTPLFSRATLDGYVRSRGD